jgi:hypothetical protein
MKTLEFHSKLEINTDDLDNKKKGVARTNVQTPTG